MMIQSEFDAWSAGQSYEHYMGRWSRKIAAEFVNWVEPGPNLEWLEFGCGTGALTKTILSNAVPRSIVATDLSADFVAHASADNTDARARFEVETRFADFEKFWHPFTLGAGPAPGYCNSLSENGRQQLKEHLAAKLGTNGPVVLPARAWAVKAHWPESLI